jgi:hypothetical protein
MGCGIHLTHPTVQEKWKEQSAGPGVLVPSNFLLPGNNGRLRRTLTETTKARESVLVEMGYSCT